MTLYNLEAYKEGAWDWGDEVVEGYTDAMCDKDGYLEKQGRLLHVEAKRDGERLETSKIIERNQLLAMNAIFLFMFPGWIGPLPHKFITIWGVPPRDVHTMAIDNGPAMTATYEDFQAERRKWFLAASGSPPPATLFAKLKRRIWDLEKAAGVSSA